MRTHQPDDIGWLRAVASGVAIVVIGLVGTVFVPHEILTDVTSINRAGRERLAAAFFLLAIGVLAWVLRRLQARGVI